METISYFLRYLPPIILSFLSVIVLTVFNVYIYKVLPVSRSVETMEVVAYSIQKAGPIAYALCFLFFFYGGVMLNEDWLFAKIIFTVSIVLIMVGFSLNLVFLSSL
jgi:heme/copper-type cytochrome/quinol oxidase subunit 4